MQAAASPPRKLWIVNPVRVLLIACCTPVAALAADAADQSPEPILLPMPAPYRKSW